MTLAPRFLTVAFILALLISSSLFVVFFVNGGLPGHEELDDNEYKTVPSPDDSPEMNLELTCHACSYSVRLMQGALEKVRVEFERQPGKLREYHALAAVEDVCKKHKLHVGLLAKDRDDVTTEFIHEVDAKQKSAGQHVLKGGWITRFFYQKCEDMLTIAEDNMKEMMKGGDVDLCPPCKKFEQVQAERKKKNEGGSEANQKKKRVDASKKKQKKSKKQSGDESDDM